MSANAARSHESSLNDRINCSVDQQKSKMNRVHFRSLYISIEIDWIRSTLVTLAISVFFFFQNSKNFSLASVVLHIYPDGRDSKDNRYVYEKVQRIFALHFQTNSDQLKADLKIDRISIRFIQNEGSHSTDERFNFLSIICNIGQLNWICEYTRQINGQIFTSLYTIHRTPLNGGHLRTTDTSFGTFALNTFFAWWEKIVFVTRWVIKLINTKI